MDPSSPEPPDPLVQTQADMANRVSIVPGSHPSEPSSCEDQLRQKLSRQLSVSNEENGRAKKMKDGKQTNEERSREEGSMNQIGVLKAKNKHLADENVQLKDKIKSLQELKKADSCYSPSATQYHGSNHLPVQIATQTNISSDQGAASTGIPDDNAIIELLMKNDADFKTNENVNDCAVDLSNEELVTFGKHKVPRSLLSMVARIYDAYGDITANCKMTSNIGGAVYRSFCAVIKEMDDLKLGQVTGSKIETWRNAINDAMYIGFDVGFALVHLRKITQAYGGLKLLGQSQLYSDSIEVFSCKSVGEGLFSQHS